MAKQKPIEIFTPPNALKAKIGGAMSPLDRSAIAKANKALADLASEFQKWIEDELDRLDAAWEEYVKPNNKAAGIAQIHSVSHDLKGLAKTYEYPLVGSMAGSLCRLTNSDVDHEISPPVLIKAHIDGVRAAIKGRIKNEEHPVGGALLAELDARVSEFEDKHGFNQDD